MDADVNRVRVLTVVYAMRKEEIVLVNYDKKTLEILATVKVPWLCYEDSPEHIGFVKTVKELILNFVRLQ